MLDVTLDLISQTASSSLFAFCFCNLIIVIILLGSKPVNSAHDQKQSDHAPPLSVVSIPKTVTHDDEAVKHNGLGMEERDILSHMDKEGKSRLKGRNKEHTNIFFVRTKGQDGKSFKALVMSVYLRGDDENARKAEKVPCEVLSVDVSKETMFEYGSTLDLIRYVVSNSLFIFCFCNLIIVIILMGSNKTRGERERCSKSVVKKQGRNGNERRYKESKTSVGISEGMIYAQKEEDENDRTNDGENDKKEKGKSKDEDELRKRVEEFIKKVNKEWKTEMLRT
ncbi:hypothetical protein G4B88_013132 [Cannabis sativa]|uniref:Uncharacterized protein n=2 Tax=Cannabis sativa TaxID=3483 RepID=A0A7J6I3Q7_CANSA|nr:hypothetical protein G4B88_013132 [Cannabis sativa]